MDSQKLETTSQKAFKPNTDYVSKRRVWSSHAKTDGFVGGKVLDSIESSEELSSIAELLSSAKGQQMVSTLQGACERLYESFEKGHIKCPSELKHPEPKGSGWKRLKDVNLLSQIDDEIASVHRTEYESQRTQPDLVQIAMSNSDLEAIENGEWQNVHPKVLGALFDDGQITEAWNGKQFQLSGVSEWSELHSNPSENDVLSSRKGVIQPKRLPNIFGNHRR